MYTKVMRWSHDHRDHYAFEEGQWVKVQCMLASHLNVCTAPATFPRGTKFDYNGKLGDYFGARDYH